MFMGTHLGAVPCAHHTPHAAKQLLQKNHIYIHQLLSCCNGSHLLIVVGCVVERGEVTSEVGGITFGVDGADTGESVQGGLIHWVHPEEVVAEQGSGEE